MSDAPQSPKSNSTPKECACIFVDAANYHYGLDWRIDYQKFAAYYRAHYEIAKIFYYEGIHSKKSFHDQRSGRTDEEFLTHRAQKLAFFKRLRALGLTVRTKPIGSVYDKTTGRLNLKCNFDVELTIDALEHLSLYETAILCSGDGDFTRLVRYLKAKGKSTIVVAPKKRMSSTLMKAANKTDSPHLHRSEWEQSRQAEKIG